MFYGRNHVTICSDHVTVINENMRRGYSHWADENCFVRTQSWSQQSCSRLHACVWCWLIRQKLQTHMIFLVSLAEYMSYIVLFHLIPFYLVSFHFILSYSMLLYLFPFNLVLFHFILSYFILSCLIPFYLVVFHLIETYLIPFYFVLSYVLLSFSPFYLVLFYLFLFFSILYGFKQLSYLVLSCTDVCFEPMMKGPCRAYITRYAYDPDQDLCVPFKYGGCGGNNNNFETLEECLDVCGSCHPVRCKNCPTRDFVDRQGCRTCKCFGKIRTVLVRLEHCFHKIGTVLVRSELILIRLELLW